MRPGALADGVPEREGIVANPGVARHDRDKLRRLAKLLGRRKMYGVERTDRLHRKGATDASEYRPIDVEDKAAPFEGLQGPDSRLFFNCR